jgi:hypothetical protein
VEEFKSLIQKERWKEVFECKEPNDSFKQFMNTITYYFNIAFPIKVKFEKNPMENRWVTKGLIISRKKLRFLWYIKRTTCISIEELKYIQNYQRIFRKVVIEAKKKEADRFVLSSKNKNKALWKLINKEIGKTQKTSNIIINIRDKIITNPQIISDHFNTFFVEVIEDLLSQKKQLCRNQDPNSRIIKCPKTMFLSPVTEVEIERVIRSLKNSSSAGYDEIRMSLVKQCLGYFIKPLGHIYNVSFQMGIFLDIMKCAKIKPLHKKGDKQDIHNYRPISILSAFSKILKRLMYNRLLLFLKKHNILTNAQHGFRKKKSTGTASQL